MNYYVLCPAQIESGGPELAHQMCHELNSIGRNAYMYYIKDNRKEPVDMESSAKYKKYETLHVIDIEDVEQKDSVVIINEGSTPWAQVLQDCRKVLWWMSVDNYILATQEQNLEDIKREIELHLVQSHYAYNYLIKVGVPEEKIMYVSDYIADKYMMKIENEISRMDIALYNPKKGLQNVLPLMERTAWLKWIPLINLSEEDMIAYMHISKLYVDFGNHPGKDRIPREAAVCGCCVVTNKEGSAAYYEDVPIPEEYKFENLTEQYDQAAELLRNICDNYGVRVQDFEKYRQVIRTEKNKFSDDVMTMVKYFEEAK